MLQGLGHSGAASPGRRGDGIRFLQWSGRELGAPLVTTEGVVPVNQPASSLAALRGRLEGKDGFRLAALHELVTLSGSLLLGRWRWKQGSGRLKPPGAAPGSTKTGRSSSGGEDAAAAELAAFEAA